MELNCGASTLGFRSLPENQAHFVSDLFQKLRELEVGHRLLLVNTSGVFGQQLDQLVPENFS